MSSDADALLAAVWASPDDDLPRLVYADFIEERGEADRAEFIRLQVARAAAEAAGDDVSDAAHWREEELAPRLKRWKTRDDFSRGFLAPVVRLTASEVRAEPPDPPPARLELRWAAPNGLARLLRAPVTRLAERVSFCPTGFRWTDEEFTELAAARQLGASQLELLGHGDSLDWLARLDWPRLVRLGLPQLGPGRAAINALAAGPLAARLVELDLRTRRLDGAGFGAPMASSAFPRLRVLRLLEWCPDGGSLADSLRTPLMSRLHELDLSRASSYPWRPAELFASLAADLPPSVRVLRLPGQLGKRAAQQFAESPALAGLRELHTEPNRDSAAIVLAAFGDRLRPAREWAKVRQRT